MIASYVGQKQKDYWRLELKNILQALKNSPSVISDHRLELNHDFDWEKNTHFRHGNIMEKKNCLRNDPHKKAAIRN